MGQVLSRRFSNEQFLGFGANGSGGEYSTAVDMLPFNRAIATGKLRPVPEIIAIAQAAGWPAHSCSRAALFDLVEVWVENAFMIEFFDPEQAARFERVVTVQYLKKALAAQPERAA